MGQNFDRPLFPKFEAPWVGDLPYMLKIAGEALGLLGCVLKKLKILMKFNSAGPVSKNDQNFDRPLFPKFEAIWVGDLPYMLKNCGGGPRPIRLCVEKT